jgi:hypothetical protein
MDKIQQFFSNNPVWGGVLMLLFGIMLLLASIFDWNWIFGNINTQNFNTEKLDGLVNFLGRKPARFICGLLSIGVILGGIVWIKIYWK